MAGFVTGPSAPIEVSAFIRSRIEEIHAQGKTYDQIAAHLGVSKTQVLNVRDSSRGAGRKLETAFARVYHGGSIDDLRKVAAQFYRTTEQPERGPRRSEPCPTLAHVLEMLGDRVSPEARASVLAASVALPDLSDATWIAMLLDRAHGQETSSASAAKMPQLVPPAAASGTTSTHDFAPPSRSGEVPRGQKKKPPG